jgi:carbon monoxide dehydrogenase subunit G
VVKAISVVLGVIVILVGGLLIFAATKPDTFRVARATTIEAPPEKIFAMIDDFHKWGAWSPYERLDPEMARHFSGSETGVGSVYAWEGSSKVGQGRMEITEATPSNKITIKLDFMKPFEAHNIATFVLEPKDGATAVTWAMDGPSPYLSKVLGIFFDMDKMIGKDFEAGLANLKAIAEQ